MLKYQILFIVLVSIAFGACDGTEPNAMFDIPSSYSFERNGESTVNYSGQTDRILMGEELIQAMQDFSLDEATLKEMFANETTSGEDANPFSNESLNASTKSIKSKVASSSDFFSSNTVESASIKDDFESWISAHISEIIPNQNMVASAGQAGQIADGSTPRYINAKGLEYNQAINKGLIGALMVDQMINNYLSTSVLDAGTNIEDNDEGILATDKPYTNMEHKWDEAYGYLFGASEVGVDPMSTLGSDDNFLNKYLARVDSDEDFSGIAMDIYNAFKHGRAAIVARDYVTRDEQAAILRDRISTVVAVRAVYYLQQGKVALETGDLGGGFHDLSEGFGFIYSLRFLRNTNENVALFTRSKVDSFISDLMAGHGFWEVTSTTLDSISEAIASQFSFTISQAAS